MNDEMALTHTRTTELKTDVKTEETEETEETEMTLLEPVRKCEWRNTANAGASISPPVSP
jgi:hypothetical protein